MVRRRPDWRSGAGDAAGEKNLIAMTAMKSASIVGVGLINQDIVAVVPHWGGDEKVNAERMWEQIGGPVPVALCAMAWLGLPAPPHFIGVVADDADGKAISERLTSAGIIPCLTQAEGGRTSRSLVLLNSQTGTRFVANHAADLPPLTFDARQEMSLQNAHLLHLDGRDLPAALRAAQIVRASGGTVSLDLGTMRPGREALFPLCDILIASRKGGAGAFPEDADNPLRQVERFLQAGVGVSGVTLGAEGVVIGSRSETPRFLPAFAVENVRDTCGAGDLFHGAFLWAHLHRDNLFAAAAFAQAAVALRIPHYGNQDNLPRPRRRRIVP